MEPAKTKVRYVINSNVVRIEKRKRSFWVSGYGDSAVFHEQNLGWWMLLSNSHEAIYVGEDQPDIISGDPIRITIERADA